MPGEQWTGGARRPGGPGDRHRPQPAMPSGPSASAKGIIEDVLEGDMGKIDARAEELARRINKEQLSASQVRNFYGAFAKIRTERDAAKRLQQLKQHRARLAYLTARAKGSADPLWDVFGPLLRDSRHEHVDAICSFAEAIVAYHKYFEDRGGRAGREARNG